MKPKELGNEDKCWQCGTHVICREVPASGDYLAKPQWQNKDGSPHYKFNFTTKETSCNIPKEESSDETLNKYAIEDTHPIFFQEESIPLDTLNERLETLTGICQSILHIVSDLKLQNKEETL